MVSLLIVPRSGSEEALPCIVLWPYNLSSIKSMLLIAYAYWKRFFSGLHRTLICLLSSRHQALIIRNAWIDDKNVFCGHDFFSYWLKRTQLFRSETVFPVGFSTRNGRITRTVEIGTWMLTLMTADFLVSRDRIRGFAKKIEVKHPDSLPRKSGY